MPAEPTTVQKLVKERRSAILDELRILKPELVKELTDLDDFLAKVEETPTDEYFAFRSPLDAILAYLEKIGHGVPKERIAKDVANGGYGRGQISKPYWTLIATLNYHLEEKKTGKKKPERKIIERYGLIGKAEWPVKLFKPLNEKGGPPESEP